MEVTTNIILLHLLNHFCDPRSCQSSQSVWNTHEELIQCTYPDQHRNKRAWADWTIFLSNFYGYNQVVAACSLSDNMLIQSSCLDTCTQQVPYRVFNCLNLPYPYLTTTTVLLNKVYRNIQFQICKKYFWKYSA